MAKVKKDIFCVDSQGEIRGCYSVLSVKELANGDVLLIFPVFGICTETKKKLKDNKYSLHTSPDSDGNLIKQTRVYTDGSKNTLALWSKGIKKEVGLILLFTKAYDNFLNAENESHCAEILKIINAQKQSLIMSVFIAHKDYTVDCSIFSNVYIKEKQYGAFKIFLVFEIFDILGNFGSFSEHSLTINDKENNKGILSRTSQGLRCQDAYRLHELNSFKVKMKKIDYQIHHTQKHCNDAKIKCDIINELNRMEKELQS